MRLFYTTGLLLAAALTGQASAATPAKPTPANSVISKGGLDVSILPSVGEVSGSGFQVTLDVEVRAEDVATRLGFHSMRVLTSVNCAAGENQVVKAEGFTAPGLDGAAKPWPISGKWVHPEPDSYMSAVIARVCSAPPARPSAPIAITQAPLPPPTPKPAPATPAPSPPAQSTAETQPTPPTATAAVTPEAHIKPPSTTHTAAVAVVTHTPAPRTPAVRMPVPPPAPPALVARTAGPGRAIAQVTASPTEKGAQRVLAEMHSLIAPPLSGSVDPAQVGTAKVWRANVSGFTSMAEAKAFCARASAIEKGCWVRPAKP